MLAVGSTYSNDGDITKVYGSYDAWIIKIDSGGEIERQNSFGGSNSDIAISVVQTEDNCFLLAGNSESNNGDVLRNQGKLDCWIAKISSNGNLLWSRTFGGEFTDMLTSIKTTQDGGFIVSGSSFSNEGDVKNNHGNGDALVAKFDFNGNLQWLKLIGGSSIDNAKSILETSDRGFVICGGTLSNDGDINHTPKENGLNQFWLFKLNNSGRILWSKIIDEFSGGYANSIQQTDDKGFISAGYHIRNNSESDFLIVKFSPECPPQSDVSDSLFSIVAPTITAMNIDMGQVVLGSYKDSVITAFIKNTSKYDCLIKDIKSASSDFYVISNPTFTLEGGKEKAIEIHFKPGKLGKIYSSINIVTQDTSFSQLIEGEGVQPTLQISANLIDFGKVSVGEQKDTAIVLLENVSGGPIDISDVKLLGPDKKQFEILEGVGAFTLGSGIKKELKLRFTPVYIGRTSCMLGFFHNGINSPAKAQLYGHGVGGLITVSDDSAYAGDKVRIDLTLSRLAPSALQNVASSFKVKLKYLTAPLSLVNPALKLGETPDSTIIEASGPVGADSILYSIDFTANNSAQDFTTIDIEEIRWFDAGGNEVDYEAETQNGSFKLLKYSGIAKVFCTSDSAAAGEKATINLCLANVKINSVNKLASSFRAAIQYEKSALAPVDKSLLKSVGKDSAYIEIHGNIGKDSILYPIEFIAGLGANESTSIDITDFKWLDETGEEIEYETETESGSFRLLGVCREGGARLVNPTGKADILSLAPNPARDEITVTVNQIEEGESFIVIYNSLGAEAGRIVLAGAPLGEKDVKINLATYPRGAYFIRFQTPTASTGRMVIIE